MLYIEGLAPILQSEMMTFFLNIGDRIRVFLDPLTYKQSGFFSNEVINKVNVL